MRHLALDLGTKTGWAVSADGAIHGGVWKLATPAEVTAQRRNRADRNCDIRVPRLFARIKETVDRYGIREIFFEDVQFIKTVAQGQLWASLRSCVWLQTGEFGFIEVKIRAVPVPTLKKFATGWHNASKEQMISAARKRFPGFGSGRKFDDNLADALNLLAYGSHESRGE